MKSGEDFHADLSTAFEHHHRSICEKNRYYTMGTCPLSYAQITTKGEDRRIYTCAMVLPYVPLSTDWMLEFDEAYSPTNAPLRHKQKRVTIVTYLPHVKGHTASRESISASQRNLPPSLGSSILRLSPPSRTTRSLRISLAC